MNLLDAVSAVLLIVAVFFFAAGTIALIRLPDLHSRLHALTKADNVGLGFAVLAMMLHADNWAVVFKLLLTWILIIASGASVCFLIANRARREGVPTKQSGCR
jgi:multicomponent Na+:H+ antiporter subunit G